MAVDKLINETQGNDIIDRLDDIASNLENVAAIIPAKFGMGLATCDTAADTAAKTCTIPNFALTNGAPVSVKFTYSNSASNATLNINGTGAKPMYYKGNPLGSSVISAGDIATFVYSSAGVYHIINIDTLTGAGTGTVTQIGGTGGITTNQTSGAPIQHDGNVKLNLKSDTAYTGTVADPSTDASIANGNVYPVALDGDGHPVVGVPWTDTNTTYEFGSGTTNGSFSVTPSSTGTPQPVAVYGLKSAAYTDSTDYATSSHVHGSITNDGTITDTGVALADGDSLAFVDSSDSSKIKKTSITFDGDTTTKALTQKGSFETFLQSHQTIKQDGVTGATVNRFGTCSIAADTAAKTVSITTGTFALEAGARVTVKFSNANTASSPTLNVNSTGAKNIYSKGSQITTGDNKALLAGTVDFIYDGTQYHLIGNYIGGSSAVTGVKGSNESSYRTGNVSLSYSNVGAAAASHSHSGYASTSELSNYVKQAYWTSNKTSGSLNDLSEGRVFCTSNCTNMPMANEACMVETIVDYNGSYKRQIATIIHSGSTRNGITYTRIYYNGAWSTWSFEGSCNYKDYEIGLYYISFTKSGATNGAYYYSFSVADDFALITGVSVSSWSGVPYSIPMLPYSEASQLRVGLIAYTNTEPTFVGSGVKMTLRVTGWRKM